MVVFANLTGTWTELGDNDSIENEPVEMFVNYKLLKENFIPLNGFLKISHDDFVYNVHISQIQWLCDRY